jgi:Tol biopolymer transport system component
VSIASPPRPPTPDAPEAVEALDALIEEARRRARKRRMRYATAGTAAAAVALAVVGFSHRGGHSPIRSSGRATSTVPSSVARHAVRANGVLAFADGDSLAVINPDGSAWRRLTRCPGTVGDCQLESYSWSPDGERLAFLSGHLGGAATSSNLFLFVINSDGSGKKRLARCGNCDWWQNLSWSPDSKWIAFAAEDGLRIARVTAGTQRLLTPWGTTPAWSPDGSRIAYGFLDSVYSIRPDGSDMLRLAGAGGQVGAPSWSPDATKIVFDASDAIYMLDSDGKNLRVLAAGPPASGPGTPSWSPDGRHILFFNTPRIPGGFTAEIWLMKPDGSERQRLYHSRCCVGTWYPPIWSPDGKAIAVSADSANGILLMDAQGKHRSRLRGVPSAIAWQGIPQPR